MTDMTEYPIATSLLNKKALSPPSIQSVCVYCGSGSGMSGSYAIAARKLGKALGDHGLRLVYGGGSLGLMGEVARAALGTGGKVTGIIPEFLVTREKMLNEVDELIVVQNMHTRKQLMFDRSDAFVALPGGVGTLEELVEQLTWSQLGRHSKPIVIVNIDGFWNAFLDLLAHMKAETFIRSGLEVRFAVVDSVEEVLPAIFAAADAANGNGSERVLSKF
jgi:uncharacterized protein (TIGR00730 family)